MTEGTTHGTALEEGYETDAWTIDGAKRLETMYSAYHGELRVKGETKKEVKEEVKLEDKGEVMCCAQDVCYAVGKV